MSDYPSMPHTSSESDALREEAQRLALPVSEAYTYDRAQEFGGMFLSLDRDTRYSSSPQLATVAEAPAPATMPPIHPEHTNIRRAEQSIETEFRQHALKVGEWIRYARRMEQTGRS